MGGAEAQGLTLAGAQAVRPNSLIPKVKNPFFIVTPPYTRVSAGVTVLHLLCHYLNLKGESAFIVHYPPAQTPIRSLPSYASLQAQQEVPGGMLAPLITQDVLEFYDELRLTPIVIYPEVFDNPFNASFFGRYILNYPGRLNTRYSQREHFSVAYTQALAAHCLAAYPDHPATEDVLFVPTVDLDFWNPRGAPEHRTGSCHFAGKLKAIHNRVPEGLPEGSVEIPRSHAMSRARIRELFRSCETFYCYEDSALAIEAQLCGCPAVFVPNEAFSGAPLAAHELGPGGWCIGNNDKDVARARETVGNVEQMIREHIQLAPARIEALAGKWRSLAARHEYSKSIDYPFEPRLVFFHGAVPGSGGYDVGEVSNDGTRRPRWSAPAIASSSRALISGTLSDVGVRGLLKRIARGLAKHGPLGFIRLLSGHGPR